MNDRAATAQRAGRYFTTIRAAAHDVLDMLFPISCIGCGTYGGCRESDTPHPTLMRDWLCRECRERIVPVRPTCLICDAYSPTGRTCPKCSVRTPIVGVLAVGSYADPLLRAAVRQLKFKGVRALAGPLGELLARRIAAAGVHAAEGSPRILVPVPLHRRRERERGFNQARLLAEAVGTLLRIPVESPLRRTRSTSPQTSIIESPHARQRNVAGAFALHTLPKSTEHNSETRRGQAFAPSRPGLVARQSCEQLRVILVDDVLTTGATLTEAGKVLAAEGITEIWGAVIARG